jgi:hypothetical protein
MASYFHNRKFDCNQHKMLINCDLIQKYNLKTVKKTPSIKKVILHFSMDSLAQSNITNNSQIKSVLFFYLIFNLFPFIQSREVKIKNRGNNLAALEYSLKIFFFTNQAFGLPK